MSTQNKFVHFLVLIGLAALFLVSCTGIMVLISPKKPENNLRERIIDATKIPPEFPVLFFNDPKDEKPRIVSYRDLMTEKTAHPDYTLLIPAGKEAAVNDWLKKNSESGGGEGNFAQDVTIEASSEGKQSLKLHVDPNDEFTTVGWYNATAKDIYPQYYEAHRGPQNIDVAMKYGGGAFLITLALFATGRWLWRRRAAAG